MGVRSVVIVSRCPDLGPACAVVMRERGDDVAVEGFGDAPDDVFAVPLDGTDRASVDQAIDAVAAHQGEPTVLVTVPGPGSPSSILRADVDGFSSQLDEQLTLSFAAARRVAPAVVKAGDGRIVFVSAVSALVGAGWESASGAAMAGLIGLCRSLARELAPSGATVNVVAAGAIET